MTLTIQEGIDASDLSQAIYETIRAGMECDAAAARKRHEERMAPAWGGKRRYDDWISNNGAFAITRVLPYVVRVRTANSRRLGLDG